MANSTVRMKGPPRALSRGPLPCSLRRPSTAGLSSVERLLRRFTEFPGVSLSKSAGVRPAAGHSTLLRGRPCGRMLSTSIPWVGCAVDRRTRLPVVRVVVDRRLSPSVMCPERCCRRAGLWRGPSRCVRRLGLRSPVREVRRGARVRRGWAGRRVRARRVSPRGGRTRR